MTIQPKAKQRVGIVIIGRNEGERLVVALQAAKSQTQTIVYVDSGSTDNSIAEAKSVGAMVVALDTSIHFTAARARNTGLAKLLELQSPPEYVQFIDGDCALRTGWINTAVEFLNANEDVAAVGGRRRERFPDASIYNALIDLEWDGTPGETRACGGDVMMRVAAIEQVGRYNESLIAGEEPELCVRLRKAGWKIWRLEAEMTWHDADMMFFRQWWARGRRAGHAFAEGAAMHGGAPERHYVAHLRRAVVWGLALPLVIILGVMVSRWFIFLALLWPFKIVRLKLQGKSLAQAVSLTVGNIAEASGALTYIWKRMKGQKSKLIEYK